MGSYKWGYKSPSLGYKTIVTLLATPLITSHEPPEPQKIPEVRLSSIQEPDREALGWDMLDDL